MNRQTAQSEKRPLGALSGGFGHPALHRRMNMPHNGSVVHFVAAPGIWIPSHFGREAAIRRNDGGYSQSTQGGFDCDPPGPHVNNPPKGRLVAEEIHTERRGLIMMRAFGYMG